MNLSLINKNISFDFDGTLERPEIQAIARKLKLRNTIWIITRRFLDESEDVYKVADELGIPRTRIIFTNGRWKYQVMRGMNIDYHFDDKLDEINQIEKWTKTKGIKV